MQGIRRFVNFIAQWVGDGATTQVQVSFKTDPIAFLPPAGAMYVAFNINSAVPSVLTNVVSTGPAIVGAPVYDSATGLLTINFTAPPAVNFLGQITGVAQYN